jgi:putative membrane protein
MTQLTEENTMNLKMLFILILAGLAVLFIIQNVAIVEIQFLFWAIQMPRSLLIFLLLAIGVIIGWFLHFYIKHREDEPQ